ncbi:MAG: hypothetical protein KKF56_00025 [Nanoarchaeota archaeon]|nr:hypothetical protein [Nanoarchaeota archaeon]
MVHRFPPESVEARRQEGYDFQAGLRLGGLDSYNEDRPHGSKLRVPIFTGIDYGSKAFHAGFVAGSQQDIEERDRQQRDRQQKDSLI